MKNLYSKINIHLNYSNVQKLQTSLRSTPRLEASHCALPTKTLKVVRCRLRLSLLPAAILDFVYFLSFYSVTVRIFVKL